MYGTCGYSGGYGYGIIQVLVFVVACFVFSVIFLATKKWLEDMSKKK